MAGGNDVKTPGEDAHLQAGELCSLTALGRNRLCLHLDLDLLASRTGRGHIPVVGPPV